MSKCVAKKKMNKLFFFINEKSYSDSKLTLLYVNLADYNSLIVHVK